MMRMINTEFKIGKMFLIRPPLLIRKIFPSMIWNFPRDEKKIYLTFDDGVNEKTTSWILEILEQYETKASFFIVGESALKFPHLVKEIRKQKHQIGNHTFNHLNAWKTKKIDYLENVEKANQILKTHLFRPPYGKITPSLLQKLSHYKVIAWDVLSGDFSNQLTPKECWENIVKYTQNGSIIVFHDSLKAEKNLKYILPKTLDFFKKKGFLFEKIN